MKTFILIISLCFTFSIKATDIPLDSIYKAISNFQIRSEHLQNLIDSTNVKNFKTHLYECSTQKKLKQSDTGIYPIYMYSSTEYINFIIIEKKAFRFINMHDPLEKNIETFLEYFKRNNTPNNQILEYLSYIAWIAKKNERTYKSEYFYINKINSWKISRDPENIFDTTQSKIKSFSAKSNLSYFAYSIFGITNLGIIEKKKVIFFNMFDAFFKNLNSLVECLKKNKTRRSETLEYIRLLAKTQSDNKKNLELLFKNPVSKHDTIILKINGQAPSRTYNYNK